MLRELPDLRVIGKRALEWIVTWRWVLLMNAFLILPVLWYELRPFQGGPDKTILFTLPGSILWLLFVQLLARRIWITHALMFPLYLLVGVDLYVIAVYEMRLSSSTILVILENLGDSWDYTQSHSKGVVGGLLAFFAGYGFCLYRIKDLRVRVPRLVPLAPLALLAVLYVGVYRQLYDWLLVLGQDRSSPFGLFSQSFIARKVHTDSLRQAERAKSFRFGAKRPSAPAEPEVYVLVVGESSRPHNWSLYGYERDTNPRLSTLQNLVVFKDVVTQAALTRMSVPLILTRGTVTNQDITARERSIVSVYQEVGFRTHWLSTQQRDPFTGAINRYPREAETQRFFERRYDGVLVDTFVELLEAPASRQQKLFFVLHTLGSHFTLTSRYPREFAKFPDDMGMLGSDGDLGNSKALINAYDNTIRYTDHVLAELASLLTQRGVSAAFVYCSDHGENLRDDKRNLFGHFYNNDFDLPVPMLFWYSNRYAELYPQKVAAARANAERPTTTRSVFYTMADIAGVDLGDPELARLSLVSPSHQTLPRMVYGNHGAVDYDQWMAARGLRGLTGVPATTRTAQPATKAATFP
jgi:heptose-I-phosphate ethanolaminephosphotransferase